MFVTLNLRLRITNVWCWRKREQQIIHTKYKIFGVLQLDNYNFLTKLLINTTVISTHIHNTYTYQNIQFQFQTRHAATSLRYFTRSLMICPRRVSVQIKHATILVFSNANRYKLTYPLDKHR